MRSAWQTKRLRLVADVNPLPARGSGLTDDMEVSFLPMESIGEAGTLRLEATRAVGDVKAGYSYFADGDVAFAKVTPCFENGKGALMRGLHCGVGFGTTELTVLRPQPGLDARFLNYFLASPLFRGPGAGAMTGAGGLKRVPDEFTRNTLIPFPPFDEQSSIATFLDRETARIDALIEKKTRFIELLNEKRQAVITRAVTKGVVSGILMKDSGVAWLGSVPAHWSVCKLSFRYGVELGKMLDEKRVLGSDLMPYLRNQDVQWDSINSEGLPSMDISLPERQRYTVEPGDLLVCEGGDVGRAAIWRGLGGVFGYQKALHRLRPRRSSSDTSEFLLLVLFAAKAAGAFEEGDAKATISHLPAEKFRQYKFPFPPLDEQVVIAEQVCAARRRISELTRRVESSVDLLRERRAALITAAVTGQIDVRSTLVDDTLTHPIGEPA